MTFELLGTDTDETRQVLHRDAGFSCWIPGHPRLSELRPNHFGLRLEDADVTVEYRLDHLPRPAAAAVSVPRHARHPARALSGCIRRGQAKSASLRDIASDEVSALTDILLEFAVSNDPPEYELQEMVLDMGARQIAMGCQSRFAEVLLRNFYSIRNTHDLRGWCWQCLWALGNRMVSR